MYEPSERCIELFIAISEIERNLDFLLDYATARLIVSAGIAMLIVIFM